MLPRAYKPNSVIDSYLSGLVITGELERHFSLAQDTALHSGKDLAVSPSPFDEIIPKGNPSLSASASLLAPLGLLRTGVTRYLFNS